MGVRGLTTFIANRSEQYLENYRLHDTNLVVDGNCIACQLYKWHCKRNDCFGGDYDKFAHVVKDFFDLLKACNITPLVVYDGGYEKRKIKTVYSRMRDRIRSANNSSCITEGSISVFPLFSREVFVDVAVKLGVQCVRCEYEGDTEIACLGRALDCPVLSYDSDFYIFDVLYIPFSTVELRLRRQNGSGYLPCRVYRVDKFLESFGGMDKSKLPVLAVLLGNDYVKKGVFAAFYRHLKLQKGSQSDQQRWIKSLTQWLRNETPESAIMKVIGRFKQAKRRDIARKIEMAIRGYQCTDTAMLRHFNIEVEPNLINMPDVEEMETLPEVESEEEEEVEEEEEENESSNSEEPEDTAKVDPLLSLPGFFKDNFRNCLYPSCFIDMITTNTYYCIAQVEDPLVPHSHNISLEILAIIYKILSPGCSLKVLGRHSKWGIKKTFLPPSNRSTPSLNDLETMAPEECKKIFLGLLNVEDNLSVFPPDWHLYIISLKYWIKHTKANLSSIYSLLLCGIVLNYVDSKIGFYRSTKLFLNKYDSYKSNPVPVDCNDVHSLIDKIDQNESVACMKKLIHYFQMEFKMKTNPRLFDRSIVHEFAEFQSCLMHIKYLNSLLKFPFPQVLVSEFYDGTFLYNMTANLNKRTDMSAYLRQLLEGSPKILRVFELMAKHIQSEDRIGSRKVPKKRRKRKKKMQEVDVDEQSCPSSGEDEEVVIDKNNKFSVLALC